MSVSHLASLCIITKCLNHTRECKKLVEMAKQNVFPADWDMGVPIDEVHMPASKFSQVLTPQAITEFEVIGVLLNLRFQFLCHSISAFLCIYSPTSALSKANVY